MDRPNWLIVGEIERIHEIANYYANLRSAVIGKQLPKLIATFDENKNLTHLEAKYSPEVEEMLRFLAEQEEKALGNVKSVNFLGGSK